MRVKILAPHGCDRSALDERCWTTLPEGATLRDALRLIRCSPLQAKLMAASINGVRMPFNTPLAEGDVVGFFVLCAGG